MKAAGVVASVGVWGGVPTATMALSTGCRKPQLEADHVADATAPLTLHSAELPPAAPRSSRPSLGIEAVDVPGDRPVLVVVGRDTGRPIVHLHGMCAEAKSDLDAWSSSASAYGTILALQGDTSCAERATATWTSNVAAIEGRINAAIEAVQARGVRLDPRETVLVGESMGASRAEAIAGRYPEKYKRLVLIGAPQAPSMKNLSQASAIALLAGEKEPQQNMVEGEKVLTAGGLSARFWELPSATHGAYGPDGDRIMGDALGFVAR